MPASALPTITNPVVIDGTTQPGYSGTPIIEIDGSGAGDTDGLDITAGNSTVRGLVINQFSEAGLELQTNGGDVVQDSFFGTDVLGESPEPDNIGIEIDAGSTGNLIGTSGTGVNDASERNLISGNLFAGVLITGQGTTGNAIAGNLIRTDITGTLALDNGTQPVTDPSGQVVGGGVLIGGGAEDNRVGTDGRSVDDTGERNVIAGSGYDAIDIYGTGTDGNIVSGNFIGTDITGTHPLGVAQNGVSIVEGASLNWIGISGVGSGAAGNAIPNDADGVTIFGGASDNTVGGTTASARNIISGNLGSGVDFQESASGNVVSGNLIGTDGSGTIARPNQGNGVWIWDGASANTVGGTTAAAGNLISGNQSAAGVFINGTRTTGNVVAANFIGTNISATAAIGNLNPGVVIGGGAASNTIGGTVAGSGNIISGNHADGVDLDGSGTSQNVVEGNFIGTDKTGSRALGNSGDGISVYGGASANTIGGNGTGSGNLISGNRFSGIHISGAGTVGNLVSGDLIGTGITGKLPVGNTLDGVRIDSGASGNTIGGSFARAGNVIAFNAANGVRVGLDVLDAALDNAILDNSIFSNSVLGIDIDDSAPRRAPVLSAATISRSKTTMAGTLSGTDDTVFRVEFFSNPARTSEGKTYLGFIQVTTNRKGSASFSFSSSSLAVGLMVTATAADPSGNTSEFSAAVTVRNRHRSGQKTGADRKERTEDIHSSGQKTSALPPVPRLS